MKTLFVALAALMLAGTVRAQDVPSTTRSVPWRPAEVIALAGQAADWQLAHIHDVPPTAWGAESVKAQSWEQGALFVGLAALADRDPHYVAPVLARGAETGWQPGPRPFHADDYTIAASYLWDSRHGAGAAALAPTRARLDAILAARPQNSLDFADPHCQDRWCWCDALFMAPPVWFEMSRLTGDPKYAAYAKAEVWATVDALYDRDLHLFYRDSRFLTRTDINGEPLFWSRGNGWVFAGLARIIPLLDDADPDKARFVALFREMAAGLAQLQTEEGWWAPSLLGDEGTALPEESGTGFYVYGMAWGLKAGILDRETYEPVVRSGWAGLVRGVHDDGQVGYVQPVSDRPDNVAYDDWQFYGTGAFLLAATAVADLDLAPVRPLDVVLTVENPSDYDQPAAQVSVLMWQVADMDDAVIDVVPAGGWSAEMDGRIYPAESYRRNGPGTLQFRVPLKAHQKAAVRILPQAAPLPRTVQAVLNVQDGGTLKDDLVRGGVFHLRQEYAVPPEHTGHDGLIAFEGIGWENDKVAYRLYLDARNVVDIYGKTVTRPILDSIGQNSGDYHTMNDWGQDILQVDQSLGMGGLGLVKDGKAVQIGPAKIVALADNGLNSAAAEVSLSDIDGGPSNLLAQYRISSGSPLTEVDARFDENATGKPQPVAAGLVHHQDMTVLRKATGDWRYIATWGRQSLAGDDLGLALFYRAGTTAEPVDDGQTIYVAFNNPTAIRYYFGATWVRDGSGVRSQADFEHWLAATADGMEHPVIVSLTPGSTSPPG